jgi:hypothetical protein
MTLIARARITALAGHSEPMMRLPKQAMAMKGRSGRACFHAQVLSPLLAAARSDGVSASAYFSSPTSVLDSSVGAATATLIEGRAEEPSP